MKKTELCILQMLAGALLLVATGHWQAGVSVSQCQAETLPKPHLNEPAKASENKPTKAAANTEPSPYAPLEKVSESAVSKIFRQQKNLQAYLVKNFQVNHKDAENVVHHAYKVSSKTGVAPSLLLAIAAVESHFKPKAENGGAKGLMQIQASAHRAQIQAMGGKHALFDVRKNLELGGEILLDCLRRVHFNVPLALLHYNGAKSWNSYPEKVLREKAKFDAVANAPFITE